MRSFVGYCEWMCRMASFDHAQMVGKAQRLLVGQCVTDGMYYVGTKEELGRLPVVIKCDYR